MPNEKRANNEKGERRLGKAADLFIVWAGKVLEPLANRIERVVVFLRSKPNTEGLINEDRVEEEIVYDDSVYRDSISARRDIVLRGVRPTAQGELAENRIVEGIVNSVINDSPSGVEDPINPLAQIDYLLKCAVHDEIYSGYRLRLYEGLTGGRNNDIDIAQVMVFRVWDKLVLRLPEILEIMEVPQSAIHENRSRYFSVLDNMPYWVLMQKSYFGKKEE